jgi:putative phage-type endonuclease
VGETIEGLGTEGREDMSIAEAIQITEDNKAWWLSRRPETIGASEAASICGIGYDAPIDVWQRKLGLAPPVQENEAMRLGKLLEPVVGNEYRRVTGMDFKEQLYVTSPHFPWLTATLDGVREDGRGIELKTAGAFSKDWGDEESDEIPEGYLIQVHHAMLAAPEIEVFDVFVLIGGQRFRGPYTIQRDENLAGAILEREIEFRDCLLTRTPPTWGKKDSRMLAILNQRCAGEIILPGIVAEMVTEYEDLKAKEKLMGDRLDVLKTQILEAMGEAETGRLPDGRKVKRYREETEACTKMITYKASLRHYFKVLKGSK